MGDVAVLLGAGASRDADLPTAGEMTRALLGRCSHPLADEVPDVLNFVVAQLIAEQTQSGLSPYEAIDVERVMTALELLAGRHDLELSPFVSSWHPRVTSLELREHRQRGDGAAHFASEILRTVTDPGDDEGKATGKLFNALRDFIREIIKPDFHDPGVYETTLEAARSTLVEILSEHRDVSYLEALLPLARDGWLAIATLNYDLTVEAAAAAAGVPLSTGVKDWTTTGAWEWPDQGVRLLKLHGSIDWQAQVGGAGEGTFRAGRPILQYYVDVMPGPVRGDGMSFPAPRPAVIFGGRNKLRPEGPFLELLAQFKSMLDEARTLLVVGYSFRDPDATEIIRRWLNSATDRRIVIVDPGWPTPRQWVESPMKSPLEDSYMFIGQLLQALRRPPARLRSFRAPAKDVLTDAVAVAADHDAVWAEVEDP